MKTKAIGGKADGQTISGDALVIVKCGETYLLMESKEPDNKIVRFYMRAGMEPADAVKQLREHP